MFAKVCDGVAHSHLQVIIHRDLKPANVLVGKDGQPKIIDFGVARLAHVPRGHTLSGEVIGTPQYMSPEQLLGDPDYVGVRSDIYALGVMLYEIVVGRPPYALGQVTPAQALQVVNAVQPPRLRGIPAPRLADLDAIVRKALQKDPADRYQSVAELQRDLLRYLNDQPVLVRRYSVPLAVASWMRRTLAKNRALAAGLILLIGYFASNSVYRLILSTPEGSDLHYRWSEVIAARGPARLPDMSQVRLIGLNCESGLEEEARLLQVDGVTPDDPRSLRRSIAAAVDLVSSCGAKVIVLDFSFTGDSAHDGVLRDAMESAVSRGCSVVFGERSCRAVPGELTSSALVGIPGVFRGHTLEMGPVSDHIARTSRVLEVALAVKIPGGPVLPHVGLVGHLLLQQQPWGDHPPLFSMDVEAGHIAVGVAHPLGAGRDLLDASIERGPDVVYHLTYPLGAQFADFGLAAGDRIASIVAPKHAWTEFREVYRGVPEFMAKSPRHQSEFVAGKLVVIGDVAPESPDVLHDSYGGVAPGCSVILQTAAELMQPQTPVVQTLREWADGPWHLAGVLGGLAAASCVAMRRPVLGAAVMIATAGGAVIASWLMWSKLGQMADVMPVGIAFILTGCLSGSERFFTGLRR